VSHCLPSLSAFSAASTSALALVWTRASVASRADLSSASLRCNSSRRVDNSARCLRQLGRHLGHLSPRLVAGRCNALRGTEAGTWASGLSKCLAGRCERCSHAKEPPDQGLPSRPSGPGSNLDGRGHSAEDRWLHRCFSRTTELRRLGTAPADWRRGPAESQGNPRLHGVDNGQVAIELRSGRYRYRSQQSRFLHLSYHRSRRRRQEHQLRRQTRWESGRLPRHRPQ